MPPGPADDETVKMNPGTTRPGSLAPSPPPARTRSPKPPVLPIAAGTAVLAVAVVAGWLAFSPGPAPSPSAIPAPSAPTATLAPAAVAPRFAVRTAGEAEILAHEATALTIFRFAPNPKILILDFPDLLQQGLMLNRAAALVEKKGLPRDRVLTDKELDDAIAAHGDTMESYYYGHDYASADLIRFFRLADTQGLKLRPEEEMLRAMLQQERGDIKGAQESLALARSRKPGPSDPRLDQVAAAWGLAPLRDPSPLPPGKPTPALQAESGNP